MFSDGNVDASLTKFMGACENFPFLVVTLFHQVVGGITPPYYGNGWIVTSIYIYAY